MSPLLMTRNVQHACSSTRGGSDEAEGLLEADPNVLGILQSLAHQQQRAAEAFADDDEIGCEAGESVREQSRTATYEAETFVGDEEHT